MQSATKAKPTQKAKAVHATQHTAPSVPQPVLLQQTIARPDLASPDGILALQRTVGNRAVNRLLQAKLRVGPAGDRYEREADRVAAQVMRLPPPARRQTAQRREEEEALQAQPLAATITPLVQRQEDEEELQLSPHIQRQEEEKVQLKSAQGGGFAVSADLEQRLTKQQGGGVPLPAETRAFMEPRFGADFGNVRVHTGGAAAQISRQINAQAFTHGQDIYFGAGNYAPGTAASKQLLAHELTHVVQQQGAEILPPRQTGQGTSAAAIQRAPSQSVQRIFGIGKTTRKSRVYKGKPGGRQSQEKVIATINMSPQNRAAQLKRYLVDKPVKGNLNGFNVILPLLEGGSRDQVTTDFHGAKTIQAYIRKIFKGYRKRYLLEMFNDGAASPKSKFALRAGLLTGISFTFGRGSGRREHGVNKDLVALAHTLSSTDLGAILADRALIKPLTKKTLRLLQVELGVKQKEAEMEDAEDGSEKLIKQVELFNAYQKQLIEMVSNRPIRIFGSRSKHKQRLLNDLQQWAESKPREIIDRLLYGWSDFSKTLALKYKRADVTYIKALMRSPSSWKEEKIDEDVELSTKEASVLQQIEALLDRQSDKGKFKRWRQRGGVQAQIENLLFGAGGPANALETVRKLYGEHWSETLGDKLKAAGLADSKIHELVTKIEHGGKSAGGIYQQLWRRVPHEKHAKWKRSTMRFRWSRTTLDLIQQLKPGTPAYNLVQGDHALLAKIEEHSKAAHWDKIEAILGLGEVQPEEGVVAPLQPNTGKWAALLNAELTSKIINRATLYQHVFNAQQDAWAYGKSQLPQEARAGLGGFYENHDNVPAGVIIGYNAFMNQLGTGIEIGNWWSPGERKSRNRLKKALGFSNVVPYTHHLTVGDLLNASKQFGGKRRTKQELVKFAIKGLSGQELLDQWAELDRQNLVFKVKANLWGRTRDRNQKSLADLLKRPERVELERALLERIAKECLQAERSKGEAADAMIAAGMMVEDRRDPEAAIKYVAQRTRAIAGLEGAQQLSKGMQWSRFSTRSLVYKEAQSEYLGKLRSTHTDIHTGPVNQKQQKLAQGTQTLEESEKTLRSEEAAFKALRAKYNQRFKTIVMTITSAVLGALGLVFTGGLSAGPLMAGLWTALASVISKGVSTLVEYTNEGNVVVTDTFRDLFVNAMIGFIGGMMSNVGLAVRSMGAKSLYGDSAKVGAKLFGKPGISILGGWAQQVSTTIAGAPIHVANRLLQSSSITDAWQQSREEFAQKFKGLPLEVLQSYARGFLTRAVVEGSGAMGLGSLLPKSNHPKLEKLGTGKEGMQSKETFEKSGVIRPFEFDSWDSFMKSIVKGSQVNTTNYGKSFIVYKEGVPKGWEVDTSVLTTDNGPQSLANAYKSMGFTIVMGRLQAGVSKILSVLGPNKQPALTGRKGGGTEHDGYEAFGELGTEKLQQLNTLSPEDRAKLTELSTEKILFLSHVGKLVALAQNNTLGQAEFAKLNELSLRHLRYLSVFNLIKLATHFQTAQLAAFKEQGLSSPNLGRFLQLPTATLNKYAQLDAEKLARLKKLTKVNLAVLVDLGTPQLEAVAGLDDACLKAIRALNPDRLQKLARLPLDQITQLTAENIIERLTQ